MLANIHPPATHPLSNASVPRSTSIRKLLVAVTISTLACAIPCPADQSAQICAIEGRIVSEDGAELGWVVFDQSNGTILNVCQDIEELPADAKLIRHSGYIFPGLIDTHNHAHWASVPLWRSDQTFANRYEWQADPEYLEEVVGEFDAVTSAGLFAESLTYGEIRALAGGTTMIQGSTASGNRYLVRNLDANPWRAISFVDAITSAPPAVITQAKLGLQFGLINRLFLHVGEGRRDDPTSSAEFPYLESVGLTVPGVVIIHGVALTREEFGTMAQNGMYLVWSPTSNDVLYGETTDILSALEAGVTVALAPDWTISGSDNLLEELKAAHRYSEEHLGGALTPQQLFRMATVDAARVAGAAGPGPERLGRLVAGYQADFFLAPILDPDPHRSLLKTYSQDLQLVVIDGELLLGEQRYMNESCDAALLDEIRISNRKKLVKISDGSPGSASFDGLVELLGGVLEDLAPLVEEQHGAHPGFPRALP